MWRKSDLWILLCGACATFSGSLARAEDAAGNAPVPTNEVPSSNLAPSLGSSIPVFADVKKGLLNLGYNFQLNYTGDVLGNPTGGVKQGATYEGLLEMALDGDLDKIAGLNGATFHINAFENPWQRPCDLQHFQQLYVSDQQL